VIRALESEKRLGRTKRVSEELEGAGELALGTVPPIWDIATYRVQID
jgi:hypothetical protein